MYQWTIPAQQAPPVKWASRPCVFTFCDCASYLVKKPFWRQARLRHLFTVLTAVLSCGHGAVWAEARHFQSPSGNIQCVIPTEAGNSVRCDLEDLQRSFTRRPASCSGSWGRSFIVTDTGPGILNCAIDRIDPPEDPIVLPYGASLALEAITCDSEPTGITCTNVEGGGFSVRRAEQRIF